MNYICAVLECGSIFTITSGLERERKKVKPVQILVCIITYMLYFVASMYFDFAVEFSFVGYVVIYLCVKWLYREDLLMTLVVVVLSTLVTTIIEFILVCIVWAFIPIGRETGEYELLVTGIAFIVALVISKMKIYKLLEVLEKWDFIYAIVCVLSLVIFAPGFVLRLNQQADVTDYIYIVICVVVMWMLIARVQKYKLEAKIRKQYFEAYKEVIAQIRRRQHKIKNQINAAYSMFRIYHTYDELVENQKEYLAKILDYELPNDAIILEEPSVIALIYEKINEAAEHGIRMETSFSCSMVNSRVSDVMWVDLIGTVFDNAIEALDHYEGEKKIWLEIGYAEKNQIAVSISNTFEKVTFEQIERFFEMGYSTKDTGRGVGLYNVKQVVYKHNGSVNAMSAERDGHTVFTIKIII